MEAKVDRINYDNTVDVILSDGRLYRNLFTEIELKRGDVVRVNSDATFVIFKF